MKRMFGEEELQASAFDTSFLDTKCTLIEIMESIELLISLGMGRDIPLKRPVILAFGHDEEISGPQVSP